MKQSATYSWNHYIRVGRVAVALAIVASALLVAVALAHAPDVLEREPAAGAVLEQSPPQVVVRFSEELISRESTLLVLAADGSQVDNSDGGLDLNDPDHTTLVASLPPLPNDVYTVQWHIVLLDGDERDGKFCFTVGEDTLSSTSKTCSPYEYIEWPIGWIAASLGILFLAIGIALSQRLNQGSKL